MKMHRLFITFVYLAALAALFASGPIFAPAAVFAADRDPEIRQIVVTGDGERLLLSASVRDALGSRLRQELGEGGEVTFVFFVELLRKGGWLDDSLRKLSVSHSLRFDRERGEYVFTSSDAPDSPRRTASLREAEEWMASLSRVPVAELSELAADAPYAIRIQAVLRRGVPVLGRILPIGALGGIQTDRRTIEFRY